MTTFNAVDSGQIVDSRLLARFIVPWMLAAHSPPAVFIGRCIRSLGFRYGPGGAVDGTGERQVMPPAPGTIGPGTHWFPLPDPVDLNS